MGVNQSKGSVDITSTPNKGPAPTENGKTVDEKIIDEKTKVKFFSLQFFAMPQKWDFRNREVVALELLCSKPQNSVGCNKSGHKMATKREKEWV